MRSARTLARSVASAVVRIVSPGPNPVESKPNDVTEPEKATVLPLATFQVVGPASVTAAQFANVVSPVTFTVPPEKRKESETAVRPPALLPLSVPARFSVPAFWLTVIAPPDAAPFPRLMPLTMFIVPPLLSWMPDAQALFGRPQ